MFQQVRKIWQRMGSPQKALVLGVLGLLAAGTVGAAVWGSKPAFRLLKGGLDRETAAKALTRLDEGGVAYRLENDGRDVLVDAKDFEKAQAILVQNQIISSDDGSGYRGLESVSFGLTEEQQKLRMRIALEEEITRSLKQFDGIESAKVHLTPAEKSFSRRESAPAKASVVLRLRAGKALDAESAEAMARLVANAAPGLLPENVILTDTRGTLLAHGSGAGSDASGLKETRMRENYLADKAQSALDRAFGPDQTIVRVDVVMETEKVDSTRMTIVPGSKVTLQETVSSSEEAGRKAGGPVGAKEAAREGPPPEMAKAGGASTEDVSTTYDYERETVRTTREKVGVIKRLTIGVLANESLKTSQAQIEDIVKGAVGYDEKRGDLFEHPAFVSFAERPKAEETSAAPGAVGFRIPPVIELVKWGVTGVVALVLGFIVLKSMRAAKASVRVALAEAGREHKPDARRVDPAEHIAQEIERDAQSVGRLLRNWLYETSARN